MLYDYYKTVVDNIKEGDVVVYNLPSKYGEPTYWIVMETDFEDNTIYGKEVKHDCLTSFSYVPEDEALQSRWISIADLDLKSTIVLNRYELKQPVGNIVEIYEEEQEELQEEEEHNEFDAMRYHVEYNLDYARGLTLKEILKDDIIAFDGTIVSKGKVWVFHTFHGYVIIPFESIIHMHPQY